MNYTELKTLLISTLRKEFPFCQFFFHQENSELKEYLVCKIPDIESCPAIEITGIYASSAYNDEHFIEEFKKTFQTAINANMQHLVPALSEDFSEVKDKIMCRLISREQHPKLLKKVFHIPYLDMEIIFFIPFENKYDSYLLRAGILDVWNITGQELLDIAKHNFAHLNPPESLDSRKYTIQILKEQGIPSRFFQDKLPTGFFITCPNWHYGSSLLLFPELFHSYANQLNSDIYLIPLSEHHLVIEKADVPISKLRAVCDSLPVPPEIRLSNQVYLYRKESREISIVVNPSVKISYSQK